MSRKAKKCVGGCHSSNCVIPYDPADDPWANKIIPQGNTLAEMVEDYRQNFLERTERWISSLKSTTDFICGAANIKDYPKDKRFCKNSHQYRMPYGTVVAAREKLENADLEHLSSFSDIYQKVKLISKDIYQFGVLAAYDFTQRYCYSRNMLPDAVYLHAGVTEGFNALNAAMGEIPVEHNAILGDFVKSAALPKPLADLSTLHIENLLCIYKHRLARLSN